SVWGALLAALLIGVLNAYGVLVLPKASIVLMFVVMAVVLIVRPWGLLGRPEIQLRAAGVGVADARPTPARPPWLLLLGVVLPALPLVLPIFWVWMAVEIFAFALFAASLHLLMGGGGMVSFGHAAYFGLGAYGAALLLKWAGWPMPLAFVAAPLVAAAGAALFGYFCVRLTSIYFAMLTLAFAQIVYAVVHQWDEVTGGDNGVLSVWPSAGLKSPSQYYYWALAFAGAGVALLRVIAASPFGLALRAARDHARRAEAVGISLRVLQWTAFVVAGFFAGLGGGLLPLLEGRGFPLFVAGPLSVPAPRLVRPGGGGPPRGAPARR